MCHAAAIGIELVCHRCDKVCPTKQHQSILTYKIHHSLEKKVHIFGI